MNEKQVAEIWQHSTERTDLTTESGTPIRIIYPGRANDERGAAFRDVVIATAGNLIKGEVELHVKSSDWQAHSHFRDPAYNRVILHVVMQRDTNTETTLQNGKQVPILALNNLIKQIASPSPHFGMPCIKAVKNSPHDSTTGLLEKAGEKRFFRKAAQFQIELAQIEPGECLYQRLMEALGYSKNKLPFMELARRLPLSTLEHTAGEEPEEEYLARLQALLLGTAGLLPSQCHNQINVLNRRWSNRLEEIWLSSYQNNAMSQHDWEFFKVRPVNSPTRRIIAMGYLILRYKEMGLLKGLIGTVREAPLQHGEHTLERGLVVDSSYKSGVLKPNNLRVNPNLIGNQRASDIVINIVLPFVYVYSRNNKQSELARKALELYRCYPKLAENTVVKHMRRQLGLDNRFIKSAQQQQGLLHLYKGLCSQGKCSQCSLNF